MCTGIIDGDSMLLSIDCILGLQNRRLIRRNDIRVRRFF